VHHGVLGDGVGKFLGLGCVRQFAVQQQVAGFQEVAVLRQLLDRVATILQLALLAIDEIFKRLHRRLLRPLKFRAKIIRKNFIAQRFSSKLSTPLLASLLIAANSFSTSKKLSPNFPINLVALSKTPTRFAGDAGSSSTK